MYYLGVDGGGTKTVAILMDESGNTLRRIKEGPGNAAVLDRGTMAQLIRSILDNILGGEGVQKIHWGTFAFAGVGRPKERRNVDDIIRASGITNYTLTTDAASQHYAVFGEESGILIASGTGSICLARNHDGEYLQIGGWGYLLGDEGSGFYIGRQAIRFAIQDAEQNNVTSKLTWQLISFYGLKAPEDLISIIYSSKNPHRLIASCAQLVCDCAANGNEAASQIVDNAVSALLKLVRDAGRYFLNKKRIKIALTGSILNEKSIVCQRLKKMIEIQGRNFIYAKQELHPAAGAVLQSMKKANVAITEEMMMQLKKIPF